MSMTHGDNIFTHASNVQQPNLTKLNNTLRIEIIIIIRIHERKVHHNSKHL